MVGMRLAVLLLLLAFQIAGAQAAEVQQASIDLDALEQDKSYWRPALEIVAFDFLLNHYNRAFSGSSDYDVTWSSIRDNLHGPWVVDNDPFRVNQFAHPYQGSLYHAAGRSAGLNYWEASALTFLGSAWWEITGERTPPAKNDQVASGIAGSFLGEPLFRMARLVQDHSDLPDGWRAAATAAISPATGLNRLISGTRFDGAFADHDPAYNGQLSLGEARATHDDFTPVDGFKRNAFFADYSMDYGLPGQPGYAYDRPFDHFIFHLRLNSAVGVELLSTSGLLLGAGYSIGDNYRGVWGLYANYDYLSPQVFHASTTGLSLGTTGQWWLSRHLALQGTAQAGLGYSAANTSRRIPTEDSEYHYGMSPHAALSLRLTDTEHVAFDLSARTVSLGHIARRAAGRDDISRVSAGLTWRLQGRHAIGIQCVWSSRQADFPAGAGQRQQTLTTVGLSYTLLGSQGLGAVDWRTPVDGPGH